MISSEVLWENLPEMFYNIQFSWRLILVLSIFVALLVPKILDKFSHKWIIAIIIMLCALPSLFLINKLSNRIYHKDFNAVDMEKGTRKLR